MLEPAGEVDPIHGLGGRPEVAHPALAVEAVQERGEVGELSRRPALELATPRGDLARAGQIPLPQGAGQGQDAVAVGPEPDHAQASVRPVRDHERPGGQQQIDALGHDQLAHVGHEPVA